MVDTQTTGKLETILVVDDTEATRKYVVTILEQAEFKVISADSGAAAIELAKQTPGRIDLLLSDVDMPLMSGLDLGRTLKKAIPHLHVMLMSGGANGNLLVPNYGWAFIEKPFMGAKLVEMVISVLHSPARSQPGSEELDSGSNSWNAVAMDCPISTS
jgi:two-component system cell cycle sensor histidine kinase/response regulator CckA